MYLLDTNVVSELRKAPTGKADPNVIKWASNTHPEMLYLSVITVLELEMGILLMERRSASGESAQTMARTSGFTCFRWKNPER